MSAMSFVDYHVCRYPPHHSFLSNSNSIKSLVERMKVATPVCIHHGKHNVLPPTSCKFCLRQHRFPHVRDLLLRIPKRTTAKCTQHDLPMSVLGSDAQNYSHLLFHQPAIRSTDIA